jgi:hypothetical protein
VQSNSKSVLYDSNSLDFPTIVVPTQKVKGKPYLIGTLPIKITKYLGIDENTPLLMGVIRGTKTMIVQPVIPEPSSSVTIPSVDIERDSTIDIKIDDEGSKAGKVRNSALTFSKKK